MAKTDVHKQAPAPIPGPVRATPGTTPGTFNSHLPVATDERPVPLKDAHLEAVVSAAEESHAPKTRRHYASAWRAFARWCEAEGYASLPATPETVAAYFAHRATGGSSLSTLKLASAAIRYRHQGHGLDSPARSAGVKRVLRGLRRRAAALPVSKGQGQARGLTAAHLAAIRATALLPRKGPSGRTESEKTARKRGAVDVALAPVMRDALLRRSEAAALTWKDVTFLADGTARLAIRRSKTDQDGEGAIQFIGKDAAQALQAIQGDAAGSEHLFGLRSGRAVSNRIAAMARAAGLGNGFSGHSPRVGMAQDLAANGASATELMGAGRWTACRMPAHYTRAQAAGRGAVARYYGE